MYRKNATPSGWKKDCSSELRIPFTRNDFPYNFLEENFTASEKMNSGQNR